MIDLKEAIYTVSELNWNGFKNGKLFSPMEKNSFDFLITLDKRIRHQQNQEKFNIKIILFDVNERHQDFHPDTSIL
ncbi:MAG TPA: hypothetical protein PKA90_16725 [Ignavibacteria bacterium]|nr:hypothetical protein [Ignavibacteria bacterium]